MAIKTFNPTTPSRRNMTVLNYQGLSKVKPEKSLLEKVKKTAGRNSYGRITVRHIGGGNKKKYRIIDFKRQKLDVFAEVKTIEYDPNRSANIALIQYEDGEKAYILAPEGLKIGDKVISSKDADIKPGNCLPVENIPVGTMIHNIELYPGKGAQLVRSAGVGAQLMAKEFVCPPASCVTSVWTARLPSVLSVTPITPTFSWARPAAPVIWVSARPFAVL